VRVLSEELPLSKTTNKNLIYKVGWLFEKNVMPLKTSTTLAYLTGEKIHPDIFMGTYLCRHYPSVYLPDPDEPHPNP